MTNKIAFDDIDRETALRNLAVGDIFHARSRNGASLVCLVTALDGGTIYARRIHTQDDEQFDRKTGFEVGKQHTRIDCVTPFPPDIQNIFLAMDQKYQELMALVRQGIDLTLDQTKMTADEKRASLAIDQHVAANSI
jgi:hypothetical protein